MAQPTPEDANGVKIPDGDAGKNGHVVAAPGKRKRDSDNGDRPEDGDEMDVDSKVEQPDDDDDDDSKAPEPEEDTTKSREIIKAFVEVLRRYDSICREPLLRFFFFFSVPSSLSFSVPPSGISSLEPPRPRSRPQCT